VTLSLQQLRLCCNSGAILKIALGTALAASLAACGSSGSPLNGLTADQVVSKAVADIGTVPAVTMSGSFSESGQTTGLHLTLTRGKGCSGVVSQGKGGSVQLIKVGSKLWIKPDSQFWSTEGLTNGSVLQALSGKYILTGAASSMSELGSLCDVSELVKAMGTSYKGMSKGATTTVSGQQALAVRSSDEGVFYVSVASAPRLLRVSGGSQGYMNFSYGTSPKMDPPPASETVNGAQYGF
jgi:hypothetical protein